MTDIERALAVALAEFLYDGDPESADYNESLKR